MAVAVDETLVAVSDERAARIAGISMRRLRYWDSTDVVSPTLKRQMSPRNTVMLYSFQDTLELLVAARLRDKLSLQHIRRIVSYLRGEGYEQPLRQLTFVTLGDEVYFQHPDGTWEGDLSPRQLVLQEVLLLDTLREEVTAALSERRNAEDVGKTERKRGRMGSKEVFAGTRIPVETVVRYLRRGYNTRDVLRAYPALTEHDVEVARDTLRSA